jgi:hypothetical protein
MDQPLISYEYINAILSGVGLSLATSLTFLFWGKREFITEQFYALWTFDGHLFKPSSHKGIFI